METPFLGSAYVARSPNLIDDQLINLYPEVVENKKGKTVGAFYLTPGLTLEGTVGSGPVKLLAPFFSSNLLALSGTTLYSVDPSTFIGTSVGTASGSGPWSVLATSQSGQIAVVDGSQVLVSSGGAFSAATLPFSTPGSGTSLNGFGIVAVIGGQQFWQSNLNDLTTWDALNFSAADATPDGIVAVTQLHNQLVFLKTFHIEFWVNAGLSGVAFQRLPGVLPSVGCLTAATVATLADRILWLGLSPEGYAIVYEMRGYEPARRSTHAIEYALKSYGAAALATAFAFTYQQEGHSFYQLTVPGNATWVLDLTASEQIGHPVWHQRASWNGAAFSPHPARCQVLSGGLNIVGDAANGRLYNYDLGQLLDNGAQRRWLRSWRALPKQIPDSSKVGALEIDYMAGVGVVGSPSMGLRQSFDGGMNWTAFGSSPAGSTTAGRVRFNRLGMKPRGVVADRIFELSQTLTSSDRMSVALMGAEIYE